MMNATVVKTKLLRKGNVSQPPIVYVMCACAAVGAFSTRFSCLVPMPCKFHARVFSARLCPPDRTSLRFLLEPVVQRQGELLLKTKRPINDEMQKIFVNRALYLPLR